MTTVSPRTRNGKTYPGGRFMRRSLKKLHARQEAFVAKPGTTRPGSRK